MVPIDLVFNFGLSNQTYFYQKCGCWTHKSNQTQNLKIYVEIKKKKNICNWKAPDGEMPGQVLAYSRPKESLFYYVPD